MADKTLIDQQEPPVDGESGASERRAFLRRAAMVGLPVVVATVQPRTAWAGSHGKQSAAGSVNPSGTGAGHPGGGNGWQRPKPAKGQRPRGNGSLW